MKKCSKIVLSLVLTIVCTLGLCLPFLLKGKEPSTNTNSQIERVSKNKTRYEANYYAEADEEYPAQGQSKNLKGGAIYLENNSTFTMLGGTISNHQSIYGGAVFIGEGATFTMRSGTISNCDGRYGGAIYVSKGGYCNIYGGTISGNSANYGPSIYAEAGANVTISSEAVIDNNTVKLDIDIKISTDTVVVGNKNSGYNVRYIDFGSFPQTYVGNSMNTTLENWYSSNSPAVVKSYPMGRRTWQAYQYTDGNIYARGASVVVDSNYTYRSGTQVKATNAIAWFKVEPIRWLVTNYNAYISGSADKLELMSYMAIASDIAFNTSTTAGNRWETSHIRTWLNGTFFDSAFTTAEQLAIARTTIGNNITNDFRTEASYTTAPSTVDKIYIQTYFDCINSAGFFCSNNNYRQCSPTDFAISNNCWKYTNATYATATHPNGGTCWLWTRAAGTSDIYVCLVGSDGYPGSNYTVTNLDGGVRPILRLTI